MAFTVPDAHLLALRAHEGQVDKQGRDYYLAHLRPIAEALRPYGPLAEMAGALHDIVEDTRDLPELRPPLRRRPAAGASVCPRAVVEAIDAVTRRPGVSPHPVYIRRAAAHPLGRLVKLVDNKHNLDAACSRLAAIDPDKARTPARGTLPPGPPDPARRRGRGSERTVAASSSDARPALGPQRPTPFKLRPADRIAVGTAGTPTRTSSSCSAWGAGPGVRTNCGDQATSDDRHLDGDVARDVRGRPGQDAQPVQGSDLVGVLDHPDGPITVTFHPVRASASKSSTSNATTAPRLAAATLLPTRVGMMIWPSTTTKCTGWMAGSAPSV